MKRTFLLACGIVAPLLYVGMNIYVARQWPEYRSASQTVSELSAIGAPTRTLWVSLGVVYTVLIAAGGATMADTLHIAFTVFTVLLTLLAMGVGAAGGPA